MKKIKLALAALLILPVFALAASQISVPSVEAQPTTTPEGIRGGVTDANPGNVPEALDGDSGVITDIINVFLYIIGVIAVIMLIFGGFQYLTSAGSADKVKNAKNTIIYAIIGLIIAVFAYAIINWVLDKTLGA